MSGVATRAGAALLGAACVLAAAATSAPAASLAIGEKYSSFDADGSRERGSQFLTPVAVSAGSEDGWFAGLSTGYVVSAYRPPQPGADEVTFRTLLDTKVSLFYTFALSRGCVRLGSTFNLPTGTDALTPEESLTEMDRRYGELVDVPNFGEGTNANPGFAFTLPLDPVTIGVGMSYHVKGEYDPTADVEGDNVDPGDEALGKLSIRWKGKVAKASAGVKYQWIGADKVGGRMVFKEGNMLSVNAKLEYTPRPLLFFVQGAYNTWDKSRSVSGVGNLPLEEFTRYGDDALARATVQYVASKKLVLLLEADGHWAQKNGFPRDAAAYDAGRTSYLGQLGFVYEIFAGSYLHGSAGYQRVEDRADAQAPEGATYNGLKASLQLVTWFK